MKKRILTALLGTLMAFVVLLLILGFTSLVVWLCLEISITIGFIVLISSFAIIFGIAVFIDYDEDNCD